MKKLLYILSIACFSMLTYTSCDDEDYTGDSGLTPTNPTVSFDGVPPNQSFMEMDTTFTFTVVLSEPQIVDMPLYISQVGGTASNGSDFVINNTNSRALIAAGRTSATVSISILPDDVPEDTEELVIQVGDARLGNGSVTPQTITFSIENITEEDLHLDLSWSMADVFNSNGEVIAPELVADIDFYVRDADGADVAASEEGGAFESITLSTTIADGTYTVVAALWDVIDLEPGAEYPTADLNVHYDQLGVQSGSWDYSAAIDLNLVCSVNTYTVATVTKTGSNWSLDYVGESNLPNPVIEEGTYTATQDDASGWFGGATTRKVEITATNDGTYVVQDVSAGGYELCCLGFGYNADQPAEIAVNGCLQVAVVGSAGSQIDTRASSYGLGSYDEATQTITVVYADDFNDSDGLGANLVSTFVKD